MTPDHFEATFVVNIERAAAWARLFEHPVDARDAAKYWLPGFDSVATVDEQIEGDRARLTKDDEPCAGTEILVTLTDTEAGTRITVVQSRFGDWLPTRYDVMAVGWRHIVADLQAYLATGVHAARHFRPWGDLGAEAKPTDGGLQIGAVRPGTLAARFGLVDDDLLVVLAGAPVSTVDDLVTVLRVIDGRDFDIDAEWVRKGSVQKAMASAS